MASSSTSVSRASAGAAGGRAVSPYARDAARALDGAARVGERALERGGEPGARHDPDAAAAGPLAAERDELGLGARGVDAKVRGRLVAPHVRLELGPHAERLEHAQAARLEADALARLRRRAPALEHADRVAGAQE